MKRIALIIVGVLVGGFLIIQLVPYGRNHANPPVLQEPNWDSPETRALAERACFACHSNETAWPWYSNIAPISWLTQHDTEEGRQVLNFSEWGTRRQETHEIAESIQEGAMPMPIFLVTHPEARLTDAEKQALIRGLNATVSGSANTFSSQSGDNDGDHD
ncbi:MAG: heme-binding domain-containing protein [Ardenticatenaceae bacterium]|nr:heme-binding domain-containing protein [Ardenticatenaceae bacterium]MCB8987781.1 heme-binding domain-containing protein [Ardenticatenaceae bacterium]